MMSRRAGHIVCFESGGQAGGRQLGQFGICEAVEADLTLHEQEEHALDLIVQVLNLLVQLFLFLPATRGGGCGGFAIIG